jgi:hypothetical protein
MSIAHVTDGVTDLDSLLFNPWIDAINDLVTHSTFVNVRMEPYAAAGDGTTNDRAAIQAAIDVVAAAGGGTVFVPAGTYKVQITETGDDTHCLTIDADYVRLLGEPGTHLDCFPYGGDPDTNWQVVGSDAWRGGGVFVTGGANYAARRQGVVIENIEIDGNFTYTGDHSSPADISDGTGWDITHKGVWFENDLYHDNHTVRDCHIHNFSGEIVYSGGADESTEPVLGTFTVQDNLLHDSNGSIISIGGRVVRILQNDIHTSAGSGIEHAAKAGWHEVAHNRVRFAVLDAISVISYGEGTGGFDVHHNRVEECDAYGIGLYSAWTSKCHHNTLVDCEDGGIRQEIGSGYPNDWSQDVAIFDNIILADHADVGVGILMGFNVDTVFRNQVKRNIIGQTKYGQDNGFIVLEPYSDFPSTDHGQIDCRENSFIGTHGDNSNAATYNDLLTTTAPTNVVTFKPPIEAMLLVSISYRVITAATNVTVKIHGTDTLDGLTTFEVQALANKAAGSYLLPSYLIAMGQRGTCAVEVTAGTADQVYVTATIREA